MTKSEIMFNYNQAMKQAEKLDQIAKKLDKLWSDKIGGTMGTLKSAWQSDSSPQYYNKIGIVQGDLKVTSGNIKKIASSIRSTAEAVKRSELRALEIAKSRIYR